MGHCTFSTRRFLADADESKEHVQACRDFIVATCMGKQKKKDPVFFFIKVYTK